MHLSPKTLRSRCLRTVLVLSPIVFLAVSGLTAGADEHPAPPAPSADNPSYEKQIRPMLQKFCYPCHGLDNPSGGVSLAAFKDLAAIRKDPAIWGKVQSQLQSRRMPPAGMPAPDSSQRELLLTWLAHTVAAAPAAPDRANPGRVLIHRLSRTEYNNTVRDLFGVDSRPADRFPADGSGGGGFDNNADTLFIPPILMEQYLEAASEVLAKAPPDRIFFVHPGKGLPARSAARQIVKHFATFGFRRPVDSSELDRLMTLYDHASHTGASYADSVRLALKGILVSPEFLFRVEKVRPGTQPYPISDYELASRLSYFLWSSMPDEELLRVAGQGTLRNSAVLESQIRRMLKSPRARALSDNFAGQWLRVRELYTTAQPDPHKYAAYSPALRDAMYNETIDFFNSVIQDNDSLLKLLDADYTYLNEDLAKHYGIEGVKGAQMRRVHLVDHRRGGVLTMASVLTLTSYPERTSPVLRGKWVLEQILGTPVPPPPPGSGGLSTNDAPEAGLTFRQRLEKHRSKPECASCHSRMDPLGFGLENFDGVGHWRTEIGGTPVDSSGVLVTGEKFSGPVELKKLMLKQKDEFLHNLVEKMLSYALGRGLEPYDDPTVDKIAAAVASDGYRSQTLLREIVESYPFQYREEGAPQTSSVST